MLLQPDGAFAGTRSTNRPRVVGTAIRARRCGAPRSLRTGDARDRGACVAGAAMRGAESFGVMEPEAGHLVEMTVARWLDMLESGFRAFSDAEPVHADKHQVTSKPWYKL